MNNSQRKLHQTGAATLVVTIVLLVSITLVTIYTARVVLVETQAEANNNRARQALADANAAMDIAVAYFNEGGLDHDGDGVIDTPDARLTFNNNDGECTTESNMKSALVIANGTSDDGIASRVLYQCLGSIDVFGGNNPKQPLISRGTVGLTGNYSIINRYTNTTGWSGGPIEIGNSATAETFTRPYDMSLLDFNGDRSKLEDDDTSNSYTSQPVSDRDKGNGVDTIANDPRLGELTGDELFNSFFFADKAGMEAFADSNGQRYGSIAAFEAANNGPDGPVTGVIWVEGDGKLNGGTIGTSTDPVVIIFNGNIEAAGNPDVFGLVYVTGQLDAKGTVGVIGSVIVEGDESKVPPGEDPVVGHGGVDLIYSPFPLGDNPNPLDGTTTTISGSWRDWN